MRAHSTKSRKWLALLCAGVLCTSGCFTKRPPKMTFGRNWALQPPLAPAVAGAQLDAPPDLVGEMVEAPANLAVMPGAPPRPRVVTAPASEPVKTEKEPEPGITPEFSTQELETAKAETQRNLEAMDKNLTLAWGRTLNATQQDLLSKVKGFADNAREAMRTGDWVRAKTLSKKAQVLSDELAASL